MVAASVFLLATIGSPADYIRPKPTNYDSALMKDPAVANPLRSAQRLVYIAEPNGRDYQQLPVETEALGGGDCEDLATWLAQKYWENGLDARIETGKSRLEDSDLHCWVELEYNGDTYVIDSGARMARKRTDLHKDRFVPFALLRSNLGDKKFDRAERNLERLEDQFNERYLQFYGHYPGVITKEMNEPILY